MDHSIEPVAQEEPDSAEQAFRALRDEVAALRRGIELVYRQGQDAKPAAPTDAIPDYSPTLGQMQKSLQAIASRLEAIEGKPALAMTPASLGADIERVARETVNVVSRPLLDGMAQARGVVRELETLIGQAREQREQRQWLLGAGAIGAVAGVALWFLLVAFLPWGMGDRLASLPLAGGNAWEAGQSLMQAADPVSFDRIVKLSQACGNHPVEQCAVAITANAAEKTGRKGGVPARPRPEASP